MNAQTYAMVAYRVPTEAPDEVEAVIAAEDEIIGYSSREGHFTVSRLYIRRRTRPATPEEVAASGLPARLESLGYYVRPMPPTGIPWHRMNGWRG